MGAFGSQPQPILSRLIELKYYSSSLQAQAKMFVRPAEVPFSIEALCEANLARVLLLLGGYRGWGEGEGGRNSTSCMLFYSARLELYSVKHRRAGAAAKHIAAPFGIIAVFHGAGTNVASPTGVLGSKALSF